MGPSDLVTREIAERLLGDHARPGAIAAASGTGVRIDDVIADDATGSNLVTRSASKIGALTAAAMRQVATRTALAAVTGQAAGATRYLTEFGREGALVWSSANFVTLLGASLATIDPRQGVYVAPASDPTGASGAWVRQFSGRFNVRWFGAPGGDIVNDGPGILAAYNLDYATRQAARIYTRAGRGIYAPAARYLLGTTSLVLKHTTFFKGDGGGGTYGDPATIFQWADGVTGVVGQFYNDLVGNADPAENNSGGSVLEGIAFLGGYTGVESESHAIEMHTALNLRDVYIGGWGGEGIRANNINGFQWDRVLIERCRNGIRTLDPLGDSNAGRGDGINANMNRRYGVWDGGGLGNTLNAPVFHGNGGDGAIGSIPTMCAYNGHGYNVAKDQGTWCSTNAPTGTTASNQGWIYLNETAPSPVAPAWAPGMTWRDGGYMRIDGDSTCQTIVGGYAEGNNAPGQFQGPTLILGGGLAQITNWGGTLRGGADGISTGGGFTAQKFITAYGNASFGPTSGTAADSAHYLNNTNSSSILNFESFLAGVPSLDGVLRSVRGVGFYIYGVPKIALSTGNVDVAQVVDSGFNLLPGKTLQIDGNTVVSATSGLNTGDGAYSIQTKTAGYTATETSGDIIVKADLAAGFTIVLPTAVNNKARFTFKKMQAAGAIIIDGAGTETIDGGLTATLSNQYESITLVSDNANWSIV
jgi:hypothetical protein